MIGNKLLPKSCDCVVDGFLVFNTVIEFLLTPQFVATFDEFERPVEFLSAVELQSKSHQDLAGPGPTCAKYSANRRSLRTRSKARGNISSSNRVFPQRIFCWHPPSQLQGITTMPSSLSTTVSSFRQMTPKDCVQRET